MYGQENVLLFKLRQHWQ